MAHEKIVPVSLAILQHDGRAVSIYYGPLFNAIQKLKMDPLLNILLQIGQK